MEGSSLVQLIEYLRDKDITLYRKLEKIIKASEKIWEYPYLYWFTDHGILHSQKVIEHIEDIIRPFWNDPNFLTPEEIYVLCASAYLHDVGMQYLKWENNGLMKPVNQLTEEDYNAIRKRHAEKSLDLIKQRIINRDRDTLDLGLEDDNYLEAIALVCKGHSTENFSDVVKMLDENPLTPSNNRFRGKLLVALLLFADELDLHNSRVDFSKLDMFNLSTLSKLHFFRHHYIDYIRIVNQQITIHYKIHPNSQFYIDTLRKWIEGKLINQLKKVEQIFRVESEGKISIIAIINAEKYVDTFGTKREMNEEVISCLSQEIKNITEEKEVIADLTYQELLDFTIKQHQKEIDTISAKYIKTLFVPRKKFDEIFKQFLKSLDDARIYNSLIPVENQKLKEINEKIQKENQTIKKTNEEIRKKNQEIIEKNPSVTKNELIAEKELLNEKMLLKEKAIKNCLFIMGEAGIGKTNLLCYLAQKFERDCPIIFLNGGRLVLSNIQNIETIITENFNKIANMNHQDALHVMETIASQNGKHILCFIDAINECLNLDLMRIYLGDILSYNKDKKIAFVITCRDIDWRFFEKEKAITEYIYQADETLLQESGGAFLNLLDDYEFKEAWELYKNYFNLKGVVSKDIIEVCRQPIMLRFFCEAYEGGKVPEKDIRRIEIFNNYWEKKLTGTGQKRETQAFLFNLVNEMVTQKKAELIEMDVERSTQQSADKPDTTFSKVLSENIIIYKDKDSRTKEYKIGFTYEAFFEYVIARNFLNKYKDLDNENLLLQFKELIDAVQSFRNFMGAIEYIVLLLEDTDDKIYIRMLELLSTYKNKDLRNEAIIILQKLKHVIQVKNSLEWLADDDNIEINRGLYKIFMDNYNEFDLNFQKNILTILSTKSNNEFLQKPIEYIIKNYNVLPSEIQDLLIYFSQSNFINTKRRLSHVISIPWKGLPLNIYEDIIANLVKEKDKLIVNNILASLSAIPLLIERKNGDFILTQLIKNESVDFKEVGKFLEGNANLISDSIIKEFISSSIEHGDEWTRLSTVFTIKKLIELGNIKIDSDYTKLIEKLTDDREDHIRHITKDYLVRASKKPIAS